MAKSKQKKSLQPVFNEKSYIKSGRARSLPLGTCYINDAWEQIGLAHIVVTRKHNTGNITCGIFLVDLLWKGVKDCLFKFNITEDELDDHLYELDDFVEADYTLLHNIIFGSIEFADEYGIKPHADFSLVSLILEEDDERIPLIDVEFGKNGKPVMIETVEEELDDDFPNGGFYNDDYETWTREDWENFFDDPDEEDDDLLLYIFDRCYVNPNATLQAEAETVKLKIQNQHITPTPEPVRSGTYKPSEEEENHYFRLYHAINDDSVLKKHSRKLEKEVLELIQKWPENPLFYNQLSLIYAFRRDKKKVKDVIQETIARFPDYLFGRISYAQWLLQSDRPDEVPDIMMGKYTLAEMYPNRGSLYHFSEYVGFHSIWFHYFLQKKNFAAAAAYQEELLNSGISEDYPPFEMQLPFFALCDTSCKITILPYIMDALKDEKRKEQMIDKLVEGEVN